jgi:hypothetical protein
MLGRLWLRFVIVAASIFGMAMPTFGLAGDAATPLPARVIAIGDLHGDFAAWRDIARDAGLVNAKGNWTGGKTVLVQTGDIADRGPDSRLIIEDLMRLQKEAVRAGGRVIALVGNHEAMNMTGDLRYVSAGEFAAFATENSQRWRDYAYAANKKAIINAFQRDRPDMTDAEIRAAWLAKTPLGKVEHQAAWSAQGAIGKWVIGNPAVLRLGDTLFVHAGLGPDYAQQSPADINRAVAKALTERDGDDGAIINDQAGPLWYRGFAQAGEAASAGANASPALNSDGLNSVLVAQGARRMVIGHTPILSGIAILDQGRLAIIDTGISAVYHGTVSYLEIADGRWVPHVVPRSPPIDRGKP